MKRLQKRRLSFGLITAALLLGAAFFTGSASKKMNTAAIAKSAGKHGYLRSGVPASARTARAFYERSREALPAAYDLRSEGRVSTVKNQYTGNTCWAFSALDCAQSGLLSAGAGKSGGRQALPDLSERHLSFFSFGGGSGDAILLPEAVSAFDIGGNPYLAAATLSNWYGAVDESRAPYGNGEGDLRLPEKLRGKMDYRLNNLLFLPETASFRTQEPVPGYDNGYRLNEAAVRTVKRTLMETGVVGVSFLADFSENHTVYSDVYDYATHEAGIIGWDDSFSRERFGPAKPPGDGAWLVKNSWGEAWGDGGYFYISYYDQTLCEFAVYEMEEFSDELRSVYGNYQYDHVGNGVLGTMPAKKESHTFANLFTAREDCFLYAVSAYSSAQGTDAAIKVYRNSEKGKPESGELVAEFHEPLIYAGYHTVELPKAVALSKGDTFSVVETIKTQEGLYELPVEIGYQDGSGQIFSIRASIEKGQSYVKKGGAGWQDLAKSPLVPYEGEDSFYTGNAMIKAFTQPGLTGISVSARDVAGKELGVFPFDAANGFENLTLPAGTAEITVTGEAPGSEAVVFDCEGDTDGVYVRSQFEKGLTAFAGGDALNGMAVAITFQVPKLVIEGANASFTDEKSAVPTDAGLSCKPVSSGEWYEKGTALLGRLTSSPVKAYEVCLLYAGAPYEAAREGLLTFALPEGEKEDGWCLFEVREDAGQVSLVISSGRSAAFTGAKTKYFLAKYTPKDMPSFAARVYDPAVTLADLALPAGWRWENPAQVPDCKTSFYEAGRSMDIEGIGGIYRIKVPIEIKKALPRITSLPKASKLIYGSLLKEAKLKGGEASVEGRFAWKEPYARPEAGEKKQELVFFPKDGDNYENVRGNVAVSVAKRPVTIEIYHVERYYGENNPVFDFWVEEKELAPGDSKASLGVRLATDAQKSSRPGDYRITLVKTGSNPNYELTARDGILTVRALGAEGEDSDELSGASLRDVSSGNGAPQRVTVRSAGTGDIMEKEAEIFLFMLFAAALTVICFSVKQKQN